MIPVPQKEYLLQMRVKFPEQMRTLGIERYIKNQIFTDGWAGQFNTTYIFADRFKFVPAAIKENIKENQILVTFKDKATVDYILLVSRRKGYDLGDYVAGNFEWDDMLPCIDKINPEDCQYCDFREQCPDRVGGA